MVTLNRNRAKIKLLLVALALGAASTCETGTYLDANY